MRFHQHRNRLLALAGALLLPVLVAACGGGGVPGNAVATVDGEPITKSEFRTWATALLNAPPAPGGATLPDAPEYENCIAEARGKLPKPAEGEEATPDAELRQQCETQYEQVREAALDLLIKQRWLEGAIEEEGVEISDDERKKFVDEQLQQQYPEDEQYQQLLEQTGLSNEAFRELTAFQLEQTKLAEKATNDAPKVDDAAIEEYYNENKERFAQPETRDLRVVQTRTKARAERAKSAIEDGDSFASVVRRFSEDQTSKSQGGKLPGVAKGQQEQGFDRAIFGAERGELTGPVQTQFGWYVFEVTKATPASQQSLEEAKETIQQLLEQQRSTEVPAEYFETLTEDWTAKTECAGGFRISICDNGPDPTPTPTQEGVPVPQDGSGGAAPQGGAPPQGGAAPQGGAGQTAPPATGGGQNPEG